MLQAVLFVQKQNKNGVWLLMGKKSFCTKKVCDFAHQSRINGDANAIYWYNHEPNYTDKRIHSKVWSHMNGGGGGRGSEWMKYRLFVYLLLSNLSLVVTMKAGNFISYTTFFTKWQFFLTRSLTSPVRWDHEFLNKYRP